MSASSSHPKSGRLFIVATPIGNLADITLRALETLKRVQGILAEDTRHSSRLLKFYAIEQPLISLHEYNEQHKIPMIIQKLQAGADLALISDAGTPLISDPGYRLVGAAREQGLTVVAVPGPSALTAALSVSGLPTDRFVFEGFLPAKQAQQLRRLQLLQQEERTMIFYEAPHRLLATLTNFSAIFGAERTAVLAKELTKNFETIYHNSLGGILDWLQADAAHQLGEFVILVQGAPAKQDASDEDLRIFSILAQELPHKQAAALASKITGIKKNRLYNSSSN